MSISPEQQLSNVAALVLWQTTPTRRNTRRPDTFAVSKEEMADTSRQLAEMVLAYLDGELKEQLLLGEDDGSIPF